MECCSHRCFDLDDPDAFVLGRTFCRGYRNRQPCKVSPLVAVPVSATDSVSASEPPKEPFERKGNVFSGDTRPGKDSGANKDASTDVANQGHTKFVTEKSRDIIADGMKRFTSDRIAPPQPNWIRLADNVVSVLGQNPGTGQLNGTNCYIVGTGRKRVLIDASEAEAGDRFLPIFTEVMKEIGCDGLQEILVTHQHHDHFGCIPLLQKAYGPRIPVGKRPSPDSQFQTMEQLIKNDMIKYLEDENGEPRWRPVFKDNGEASGIPTEAELEWDGKTIDWDPLRRTKVQLVTHYWYIKAIYDFYKRDLGRKYPFHQLADDDIIVTQGATLRVISTPGHADDHAAFHLKEGNALFSGDHVLGFGTTFVQDMFSYVQSLQKMEALKPATLFPGHGPCIDDGTDYLQRYITHRRDRIDQVYSTLFQNGGSKAVMTAREIADILYTNTPEMRKHQAVQNVVQNLTALYKEGRAHAYEYNQSGAMQVIDWSTVGFNGPKLDVVWGLKRSAKM